MLTVPGAILALASLPDAPPYARRLRGGRLAFNARELASAHVAAQNVRAILAAASSSQRCEGATWYSDALAALERAVGDASPAALARACAAVSPGMPWHETVRAVAVLAGVRDPRDIEDAVRAASLPVPYRWRNYRAAWDALAGGDVLRGSKVSAFADGLASRGRTFAVCVDRHAVLIAQHGDVAMRPGITSVPSPTGRRYDVLALAYALASVGTGYSPAQTQAIAWVAWRSRAIA